MSLFRTYKPLHLLLVLAAVNGVILFLLPQYRFEYIVLHHSASWVDNYRFIRDYHLRAHGWRDAAYHLILSNGSTNVPLGYLEATGRYKTLSHSVATKSTEHNLRGVHLCVIGNYEEKEVPKVLKPPLAHALSILQDKYHIPDNRLLFHRECSPSECPGKYITKPEIREWIRTEAAKCPVEIQEQQKQVIGWGQHFAHPVPDTARWLSYAVSFVVTLIWFLALYCKQKISQMSACEPTFRTPSPDNEAKAAFPLYPHDPQVPASTEPQNGSKASVKTFEAAEPAFTERHIAEKLHCHPCHFGIPDAERIVGTLFELIQSSVKQDDAVLIRGFGKFYIGEKPAQQDENGQIGEELTPEVGQEIAFKCSELLKRKMNGG